MERRGFLARVFGVAAAAVVTPPDQFQNRRVFGTPREQFQATAAPTISMPTPEVWNNAIVKTAAYVPMMTSSYYANSIGFHSSCTYTLAHPGSVTFASQDYDEWKAERMAAMQAGKR